MYDSCNGKSADEILIDYNKVIQKHIFYQDCHHGAKKTREEMTYGKR